MMFLPRDIGQFESRGITLVKDEPCDDEGDFKVSLATLARGSSTREYKVFDRQNVRFSDVARLEASPKRDRDLAILIRAEYIHPKTAQALRAANIQYMDFVGNCWLTFGDVYIEVQGRPKPEQRTHTSELTGNIFSAGRARVIFALLAWPELIDGSTRALSQAAGVSTGLAHETRGLLRASGYDLNGPTHRRTALLDHWAAAYPTTLGPRLALGAFHGEIQEFTRPEPNSEYLLGGESAVTQYVKPTTLTIYVDTLTTDLIVKNRWHTDGEPNIFVRKKFWVEPESSRSTPRESAEENITPWPLVYADLLSTGDARLRAVANQVKDLHVQAS